MTSRIDDLYEAAQQAAEREPRDWKWRDKRRTSLASIDQIVGDDMTPYEENADPVARMQNLADPEIILALIEAYRKAERYAKVADGHIPGKPAMTDAVPDDILTRSARAAAARIESHDIQYHETDHFEAEMQVQTARAEKAEAERDALREALKKQSHAHRYIAADGQPAVSVKTKHKSPTCEICALLSPTREGQTER